jgi:hypothetical protein
MRDTKIAILQTWIGNLVPVREAIVSAFERETAGDQGFACQIVGKIHIEQAIGAQAIQEIHNDPIGTSQPLGETSHGSLAANRSLAIGRRTLRSVGATTNADAIAPGALRAG